MSQRILWGAVFSSVPVHLDRDSQFQTFPLPLHVRPTFLMIQLHGIYALGHRKIWY